MSDNYDTVNERTQEISDLMKLHILGSGKCPWKLLNNWLITLSTGSYGGMSQRHRPTGIANGCRYTSPMARIASNVVPLLFQVVGVNNCWDHRGENNHRPAT